MKQDWKSLPPALQHQLIIQMGLAVCCLVLAIGALAFISFSVSVPFLLGAALLTICAARLYCTGMRGQYRPVHANGRADPSKDPAND